MKRKRGTAVIAILCLMLVLAGCLPSVQLKEQAIVQGMGIDYNDGDYLLTLQIFAPKSGEDGGGDNAYAVLQSRGDSLTQAFEEAGEQLGKHIFLGNCKVLVVGRSTALRGTQYIADFFNQNQQARATLMLLVADGRAGELFEPEQSVSPAGRMEQEVELGEEAGTVPRTRLMDHIAAFKGEGGDSVAPLVALYTAENGQQLPSIIGGGIIREGELVGELNPTQTMAIQWCTGQVRQVPVTVELPGLGLVAVMIDQNTADIRTDIDDGLPSFHIEIEVKGEVTEVVSKRFGELNGEELEQVEALLAQQISGQVQSMVGTAVYGYGSDPLQFGAYLQKHQYEYWKEHSDRWRELLPQSRITVTTICSVRRRNIQADAV